MFDFWSFLIYSFIITFTPGPNNLISLNNGIKYGFKKALPFMFGVAIGFFSLLVLASFFSVFIKAYLPRAQGALKVFGALFLIYLALLIMGVDIVKMLYPSFNKKSSKSTLKTTAFLTGVFMQYINPKAIFFALTVMGSSISPYFNQWYMLVFFAVVLSIMAIGSLMCWASFGTVFNKFLAKYQKSANFIMGIFLIYSALTMLGIKLR